MSNHNDIRDNKAKVMTAREVRGSLSQHFKPYHDAYDNLIIRLKEEGFEASMTCYMAPIEIDGKLPSQETFCFHSRHSRCSLSIAPEEGDPIMSPIWEYWIDKGWGIEEAGCLTAHEVETVFRELLSKYQYGEPANS